MFSDSGLEHIRHTAKQREYNILNYCIDSKQILFSKFCSLIKFKIDNYASIVGRTSSAKSSVYD